MPRSIVRGTVALAVLAGGVLAWSGLRPYDPAPWLEDFAQLRMALGAGYANLDWKIARGEVDPYSLVLATDSAIRAASSDREARRALQHFVEAFDDGHLSLSVPHPVLEAIEDRIEHGFSRGPVSAELDAEGACARLGLGIDDSAPLLALIPGYAPLPTDDNVFQAGTLPLGDGRTIGVVRIPLFSASAFRPACERVWPRFRSTLQPEEHCTGECEDRLYTAIHAQLTTELGSRVLELEAAGARAIVVDLTGNGGGNEWVDDAARVVTRRTLRSPRVGFVRHPHWVPAFERELATIERDLARSDLDSLRRGLLVEAHERYARALDDARTPCDVSGIWRTAAPRLTCRNIGDAELYATGAFGWLTPGAVAGLASAEALFRPGAGGSARGVGSLPLLVLVDARTASASEYFAAMLRDNDAARVVGERTWGAGCGYTRGGIPTTLTHSGLRLRMPDCLRLRADGTNEIAGIEPDVRAGWTPDDDDALRASKTLAAIEQLDWVAGVER